MLIKKILSGVSGNFLNYVSSEQSSSVSFIELKKRADISIKDLITSSNQYNKKKTTNGCGLSVKDFKLEVKEESNAFLLPLLEIKTIGKHVINPEFLKKIKYNDRLSLSKILLDKTQISFKDTTIFWDNKGKEEKLSIFSDKINFLILENPAKKRPYLYILAKLSKKNFFSFDENCIKQNERKVHSSLFCINFSNLSVSYTITAKDDNTEEKYMLLLPEFLCEALFSIEVGTSSLFQMSDNNLKEQCVTIYYRGEKKKRHS
ncbi:hypothetical protein CDIK_1704 [Cucumispora dikerogammari]|nr:hypothetical protein CDIK_1704 [Cucumispora dikerogammari]